MLKRTLCIAAAFLALTSVASAEITDQHWEVSGDVSHAGGVVNDLFMTSTSDWTNCVLWIDLTEGTMMDPDTLDVFTEQNFGSVDFSNYADTWVNVPGKYSNPAPVGGSGIVGATTIQPPSTFDFTSQMERADWFDTARLGPVNNEILARMIASTDAIGTWTLENYDAADGVYTGQNFHGNIVNGEFQNVGEVPEPGTIAMLLGLAGMGGLALARRRRRNG